MGAGWNFCAPQAEGFSSREISEQILVGAKTVETYRGRLAEKLGLTSRADIVHYALEVGLLSPQKFSVSKKRERKATRSLKTLHGHVPIKA